MTLCVSSPFEITMTQRAQNDTWRAFLQGGTNHSAQAGTLPYIIRRCEQEGVPFMLKAHPGLGYWIEPQEKK
jgi:hypothetical protein